MNVHSKGFTRRSLQKLTRPVNREDTSRAYPYVLQKSAEAIETEEVNQTTKMEMLTETGHNTGL